MLQQTTSTKTILLLQIFLLVALAASTQYTQAASITDLTSQDALKLESAQLRVVSDDDQKLMEIIKHHISRDYADFKSFNEVFSFLDKVKLLVQKHPKNVAFAQGDLRDLFKFLSQESVTKLARVDIEPFAMPITDDKIPLAWHAIEEDELTGKLFSGPLRVLVEVRKQELTKLEPANHKDGNNFFTTFWCKISGGCSQHQ